MQRTAKVMFDHYMARSMALDVIWLRRRRNHILNGGFDLAIIKSYNIYSGAPYKTVERHLDYPAPLFDRARKQR